MAYVDATIERENYLYTFRRASLLSEIFYDNIRLFAEVDPYQYQHDVYDVLLSEQYDLYDGGERGIRAATDAINGIKETREEYADDEKVCELVDMLIDEYTEYLDQFTEKGE